MDGSPIAVVLIGSFAIDRIVTGTLFLLSIPRPLRKIFPDPDLLQDAGKKAEAEKKRRLNYFLLAIVLSLPVVHYGNIRLFEAMNVQAPAILDTLLTALIFVGGSDRIADVLKKHTSPVVEKPGSGAIEVTGTVTLEEGKPAQQAAKCPSCSAALMAGSSFCGHCGAGVRQAGAAAG